MKFESICRAGLGPHGFLLRALQLLALSVMLTGCATQPERTGTSDADIAWVLAGADLLPADNGESMEDLQSLLHVSEDMHRFALDATHDSIGTRGRIQALSAALSSKQGLHIQYDAKATLNAEQAFVQRRANCLSYTVLFVALARDVGIQATFNEVDIPPIWDSGNDRTFLLYKHVNARVELYLPFFEVVDISGDDYDPVYEQRVITDLAALAQFENNRAVDFLLSQQRAEALRHELRALALSPDSAYLWTNLASFYLQSEAPRAAGIAVSRALALDSSSMLAYDTAAQTFDRLGDARRAAYFRERARHFLDQNPYYHYQLALASLQEKDDRNAYVETRRAIQLYAKDHRFFFLLSVVLARLGEIKLANDSMQVALDLTQDPAQQQRYRSKFERLTKHG